MKEKELTRARDALAAERRRMPWLAVEKEYKFDGPRARRACSTCSRAAVSWGYTVVAPSWPLDDRSPAELRASPNPALAKVGINEIINHYDRLIRALPEPPILADRCL